MRYCIFAAVVLLAFTFLSCGGKTKKQAPREVKIEVPKVPAMVTDPTAAAEFLATHFWGNVNLADTTYIGKEVTEQAFANYLSVLLSVPTAQAAQAMDAFLDRARASHDVYNYFVEMAERYLYDPNSPYRNEDIYIAVLENMISWPDIDDILKIRPKAQLATALKNRVGEPATDITVTLSSGRKIKLYDIKADYTLLYFVNPDCSACAQATDQLNRSEIIRQLLDSGELKIITVYPDEDLALWNKHLGDLPGDWTNGYDAEQQLRGLDLYDLRAIPSLYLLDRDKFVLLKDIPEGSIIHDYFLRTLYR